MISMAPITKPLIFDTTVFIDYMHGRPEAQSWVEKVFSGEIQAYVSPFTDYELWAGARNNNDIRTQKALLSKFHRANLHATITRRAGDISRPFVIQRDLSISAIDSIIAATAEYLKADVLTRNAKHYRKINLPNIKIITYDI
jgi:predicted nucleic acid-binding protein